jgi:hypothetical protein
MNTLIGLLSARPLRSNETQAAANEVASADLIRQINERISPPTPLAAEDVHIRVLRLVSDEINDHGGRFPREEHERLCELLIDTPVLIGHDRTRLPVARNFAARRVNDGDRQWVEVWFYWLRGDGSHQDQLAADIDAGVVKEGSIGFEFRKPQCSICGQDIRTCEHVPDQEYADAAGAVHTAHYEYRDIVRVLETSLVYRGATPGTHFVSHAIFRKPSGHAALADTSVPLAQDEYAVILDRHRGQDGGYEYLAGRRKPRDIRVCDELAFRSLAAFDIGDRVVNEAGGWKWIDADNCIVSPSHLSNYRSAWHPPRPLLRVSLFARRRRPRPGWRCCVTVAHLRHTFGTGDTERERVAA